MASKKGYRWEQAPEKEQSREPKSVRSKKATLFVIVGVGTVLALVPIYLIGAMSNSVKDDSLVESPLPTSSNDDLTQSSSEPTSEDEISNRLAAIKIAQEALAKEIEGRLEKENYLNFSQRLAGLSDRERVDAFRVQAIKQIHEKLAALEAGNIPLRHFYYRELVALDSTDSEAAKKFALYERIKETGKWQIIRSQNPVDDSTTVMARLTADSGVADDGRGSLPVLTVMCKSNRTEAYVNWEHYLGWDTGYGAGRRKEVVIRVGAGQPERQEWKISTDFKGAFSPSAIPLAKAVAMKDSFLVQTIPYGENAVTTIFKTKGAYGAFAEVAGACHWNMPTP